MDDLVLAGRFVLATVFLVAALAKFKERDALSQSVTAYRLLPVRWSRPIALWLPRLELTCALLLAVGLWTRLAASLLAVALLAFLFAVTASLVRGLDIDCGCMGSAGDHKVTWWTAARNAALTVTAMTVVWRPPRALTLDSGGVGAPPTDEALAVMVAATLAVLMSLVVSQALALLKAARAVTDSREKGS